MNLSASPLISTRAFQLYYFKGNIFPNAKWPLSANYPVSLLFHISGSKAALLQGGKKHLEAFLRKRNCMWSVGNTNNTSLVWEEPGEVAFLEVRMTQSYLKNLLPDKSFKEANTGMIGQNSEISEIIYGIGRAVSRPKSLRDIIYEAKSMELIAVCIEAILTPTSLSKRVQRHKTLAQSAKKEIDNSLGKKTFTIIGLAKTLDTNETTLKNAFKDVYGQTIFSYYITRNMQKAKKALQTGKSVSQTSSLCGYSNIAHFSTAFKRETGITPSLFIAER
jgi:AraC-like DNA-binding protein